jgi:hypothetical protein
MGALIELRPGAWVRPEQVTAVVAYRENKLSETLTVKPQVTVYSAERELFGWEFDKLEDALTWAAKIAAKLNEREGQVDE